MRVDGKIPGGGKPEIKTAEASGGFSINTYRQILKTVFGHLGKEKGGAFPFYPVPGLIYRCSLSEEAAGGVASLKKNNVQRVICQKKNPGLGRSPTNLCRSSRVA